MPETELHRNEAPPEKSHANRVLRWARCHPGFVVLGSLAMASLLAGPSKEAEEPSPPPRKESEADIVDGETPLFV